MSAWTEHTHCYWHSGCFPESPAIIKPCLQRKNSESGHAVLQPEQQSPVTHDPVTAAEDCVRLRSSRETNHRVVSGKKCLPELRLLRSRTQPSAAATGRSLYAPCDSLITHNPAHSYPAQILIPQRHSSFRATPRIPPWCAYRFRSAAVGCGLLSLTGEDA